MCWTIHFSRALVPCNKIQMRKKDKCATTTKTWTGVTSFVSQGSKICAAQSFTPAKLLRATTAHVVSESIINHGYSQRTAGPDISASWASCPCHPAANSICKRILNIRLFLIKPWTINTHAVYNKLQQESKKERCIGKVS